MATEYAQVEVFLVFDADGNCDCATDAEAACTRYSDTIEEIGTHPYRLFKVTLQLPLPTMIELAGSVTVEETASVIRAVEAPDPIREPTTH